MKLIGISLFESQFSTVLVWLPHTITLLLQTVDLSLSVPLLQILGDASIQVQSFLQISCEATKVSYPLMKRLDLK